MLRACIGSKSDERDCLMVWLRKMGGLFVWQSQYLCLQAAFLNCTCLSKRQDQ